MPELDEPRWRCSTRQLSIYERYGAGWSLWTYKDVGLQGLVYARADSPYMRRFGEFIERKARLGVDSWGSTDRELPELVEPIHAFIAREFPDWEPYPWNVRSSTDDLLRHILFAQAMLPSYASCSAGLATRSSRRSPTRSAGGVRAARAPVRHRGRPHPGVASR